ncbi:transposase [Mesomycoplasma ovipneumoniae]|nr:transposase [Mesomycoplasma ovipneumoniae]WNM16919.1 transposase [Mesomycoplasma ovipneumoniae]
MIKFIIKDQNIKRQQQNLSLYDLVVKEIVSKYADYKKLIKEDFHNEISYRFKNLVEGILKAELSLHFRLLKRQPKQKMVCIDWISETAFRSKLWIIIVIIFRLKYQEIETELLRTNSSVNTKQNLADIEEPVFLLFASGMSYENITNAIKNIYKKEISNAWISSITGKLLPEIEKWKSQKLTIPIYFVHCCDVFLMSKKTVFLSRNHFILFLQLIAVQIKKYWDFGLKIANQQVIDLMF